VAYRCFLVLDLVGAMVIIWFYFSLWFSLYENHWYFGC